MRVEIDFNKESQRHEKVLYDENGKFVRVLEELPLEYTLNRPVRKLYD